MLFRILASAILLFSILFLPFYISIILAIAFMIYFSFFWEAVVLFLISDLLYGARESRFLHITVISFFIAIFLILICEFLKKKLKVHF
jgi:hypothetical protein